MCTAKTAMPRLVHGAPPSGGEKESCGEPHLTTRRGSRMPLRRAVERPTQASSGDWALFLSYPLHLWETCSAKTTSPLSCNTLQGAGAVYLTCGEGVQKIHRGTHVPNVSTTQDDVVPQGYLDVAKMFPVTIRTVMGFDFVGKAESVT